MVEQVVAVAVAVMAMRMMTACSGVSPWVAALAWRLQLWLWRRLLLWLHQHEVQPRRSLDTHQLSTMLHVLQRQRQRRRCQAVPLRLLPLLLLQLQPLLWTPRHG